MSDRRRAVAGDRMRGGTPRRSGVRAGAGGGAALAVVALLLAPAVGGALPAAAEVRDVRLTQDGPQPARLVVAPGDTVRFVNDDAFVHRAVSDGAGWELDTGTLVPGQSHTVPEPLESPGTYAYRGADLDEFTGSVVVPDEEGDVPAGTPDALPAGPAAPPPSRAVGPDDGVPSLRTPVPARRFGLPSVLALLAAVGVLSLLVRVLLAVAPSRPAGAAQQDGGRSGPASGPRADG